MQVGTSRPAVLSLTMLSPRGYKPLQLSLLRSCQFLLRAMRRHMKHILEVVWKGFHQEEDAKKIKSMLLVLVVVGKEISHMARGNKVDIQVMLEPGTIVVDEVVRVEEVVLGIQGVAKGEGVVVVVVRTALCSRALDIKMLIVVWVEPLTKLGLWFGVLTKKGQVEWLA